jgi:hypothetical protein
MRVSVFVSTLLFGCAVASPVSAQSRPPASIGIGYQILHIPDETYPFGITVDVVTPGSGGGLGLVADFGYARDQQTKQGVSGTLQFWNFGAGVRWTGVAGSATARPYVQLVLGGVHTNAHMTQGIVSFQDEDTVFMLQPGIGVVTGGRVAVFAQLDYRRAYFTDTGENEVRGIVGVRIGGGR